MNVRIKFVEFEGSVHMVDPANGFNYTLCRVAENAADAEKMEQLRWRATKKRQVDCPTCATVIVACQQVRVSPELV